MHKATRRLALSISVLGVVTSAMASAPAWASPATFARARLRADDPPITRDASEDPAAGGQPRTTDPAPPLPSDPVVRARLQFDEQQYELSIQTLAAVLARPSLTASERLETLRLLALNFITLGRLDEADAALRSLLIANPNYEFAKTESPRFLDVFNEARAKWNAEGRPGLAPPATPPKSVTITHVSPAQLQPSAAVPLEATLNDPDGRTRNVTLFFKPRERHTFLEAQTEVNGPVISTAIPSSAMTSGVVDYYFEATDRKGTVVATRGDATSPLRLRAVEAQVPSWVVPVTIAGSILGAAAIVGVLALTGVVQLSSGDANHSTAEYTNSPAQR